MVRITASGGMTNAFGIVSRIMLTLANMPGFSSCFSFRTFTRTSTVRLLKSMVGLITCTVPLNIIPALRR